MAELKCGESSTGSLFFPLFRDNGESLLDKQFVNQISEVHELEDIDLIHYIYAIFFSNGYRTNYNELLKIDFPRIPLTTNSKLFQTLAQMGADLVALHLMEDDYEYAGWNLYDRKSPFEELNCKFIEGSNGKVVGSMSKNKAFAEGNVFMNTKSVNDCSKFSGISQEAWDFTIGGYQICHKWLYDRRTVGEKEGKKLTEEDILHYKRIVRSIECTIYLMNKIDEIIEENGGWPLEGSDEFEVPDERDELQTGLFDF
jgi:predicted helicase